MKVSLQEYLFRIAYLPIGLLFLFIQTTNLDAQPRKQIANHWYFGNHYGLDFSSGTPVMDHTSSIYTYEACVTMSDKKGDLLFYTNGGGRLDGSSSGGIWNRNHQLMEGGDLGILLGGGLSAAQGALSIKKPGTSNQYYLFTVDELETLGEPTNPFPMGKGLSFFEIDMSANGGLGKVTVSNEKLLTPCFEYLGGTRHANCEDYWILTRTGYRFLNSDPNIIDTFYLYRVTVAGIQNPVKIPILETCEGEGFGLIRFAPDGKHILCGRMLYEFDKQTGLISNPVNLENSLAIDPYYPMAFSSNGRFLYYFQIFDATPDPMTPGNVNFKGLQFDLWAPNLFTSTHQYELIELPDFGIVGTPQLAPDGKLYIPTHYGLTNGPTQVFVVDKPNVKGSAAGLHGPTLTLTHDENEIFLRFGNFTDDIFYIDTTQLLELDLGEDLEISCDPAVPITLEGPAGMDCYLWSDGSTTPEIEVSEAGIYWLEIEDDCRIGIDSVEILEVNDVFTIHLGNDTTLCEGETLLLSGENLEGADYLWQNGSILPFYEVSSPGVYWLEVTLGECSSMDSIEVLYHPLPLADIGSDTIACVGDVVILDGENDANLEYQWSDGSDQMAIEVTDQGYYSLTVSNDCGIASDEVFVNFVSCEACDLFIPNAFSPNYDGANDVFQIHSECNFTFFNLKIFNRWGALIFEGNDLSETWDGRFKGKNDTPGVFVYYLEFELINQRGERSAGWRAGDLTLLR